MGARILTLLALSGCCSAPVVSIPHPDCKETIPPTSQIWNDLELMREVMSNNALSYQECIAKYKARVEAFNEES